MRQTAVAATSAIFAPPADPLGEGAERRACALALAWWRDLAAAGGRRAPTRTQLAEAEAPSVWPHFFVLRCAPRARANMFEGAGPVLCDTLGFDPRGWELADAWPAEAVERAVFLQQSAVDLVMPIEEAGRFRVLGEDILYRCLVMPVSDDEMTVSHLLGAISCRRAGPG
jgi:hypothetical protein